MNKIIIGTNEHQLCDVSEGWIERHVHERQHDGRSVCAQIILKTDSVDMALSTPQCARGHGGGRKPNPKEDEILKFWNHAGLSQSQWTLAGLIGFVKQVRRYIC
jgi:hypothetical protein